MEIQLGNISVEVRTENLELEDRSLGWDYELKEEAAKPKRNKTLVSGGTQRRARAQWKEREWDKKEGRREQRGHGFSQERGGASFQWNSWDGKQSEWVQG